MNQYELIQTSRPLYRFITLAFSLTLSVHHPSTIRQIEEHPLHPSSLLPPNLPKLPTSLLKNFPIFLKFSFKLPPVPPPLPLPLPLPVSGLCGLLPIPGGGLATRESDCGVCDADKLGVPPKRSTPSRAAVMIAEPKVAGSKRAGRLDVLREAAVEPREGRCVGMWTPTPPVVAVVPPTTKGVRRGEEV